MSGIFICYRRKDTDYIAGRLHKQLADHFGRDQVFRDINTIKLGSDFGERIDSFVGSCDALVAVIGNDWLSEDDTGRRRIDQPRDWVRQEIASALDRDILVIPVLVETAKMPPETALPTSLRKLARRNALDLSDARWDHEVETLIEALEEVVEAIPLQDTAPPRPQARAGAMPPIGLRQDDPPPWPQPDPSPVLAPIGVPRAQPTARTFTPRVASSPSTSGPVTDWGAQPSGRPHYGPSARGIPTWAKVLVPVVVVALATFVILTLGRQPAARTVTGPWTGTSGELTLVVESIEVGSTIQLHLLVGNTSTGTAALPVFGYFSAFDDTGHTYRVGSADWATEFPPGEIRGTIELDEGPAPGASSLKVGFTQIFGDGFDENIFVEGIGFA